MLPADNVAKPIVTVFLSDLTALDSGVHFTRILMSTAWLIGAFAIIQNTLQAVGAATFFLKAIMGVDGLILAQPIADVLSLEIVVWMLFRKINKTDFEDVSAISGC